MALEDHLCPLRAVSHGPRAHFFGYYDKPPWDASGQFMLALEAESVARMPLPGEQATVGLIDLTRDRFEPLAETTAWNWQQGCMLQWMPPTFDREIIFNDGIDQQHVAIILDIHTGKRRHLPKPIYNITGDGQGAVVTSLARLAHTRPVVGYAGVLDPYVDDPHPSQDGIYWMNLTDGSHHLIISLDEIAHYQAKPSMQGTKHRFEHLVINQDGSRFFFMHRWPMPTTERRNYFDRMFTANPDGSELHLLADDDFVSHFDWRDPHHILAWARQKDRGDHFYVFTDRTHNVEMVGASVLTRDGHCSYSPDRRWILSDTYPDAELKRTVLLFNIATQQRIDLGRFYSPPPLHVGDIRCDLHPRWSRDGRQICMDSAHEGTRQMYVLDVSEIVSH